MFSEDFPGKSSEKGATVAKHKIGHQTVLVQVVRTFLVEARFADS